MIEVQFFKDVFHSNLWQIVKRFQVSVTSSSLEIHGQDKLMGLLFAVN